MSVKQTQDAGVREVQASLARARDAQISRVVAMVDAMPLRGAADALIAPLRPRLAQIRPDRPFSFRRLLFTPLDPVIVARGNWRSGDAGIPRTVLAPLAASIQSIIAELDGELTTTLEARITGLSPRDQPAILAAGSLLWPVAADALDAMQKPIDWRDAAGLPDGEYSALAGAVAIVLRHASMIERMVCQRRMPKDDWVRDLLANAETRGAATLGTVVAVLVARLPSPCRVLALASEVTSASRHRAADEALGHTLNALQDKLEENGHELAEVAQAAEEAARVAALLLGLEQRGGLGPERRRQTESIRRKALTLCRHQFDTALAETFARIEGARTEQMLAAGCDDLTIARLEAGARDLRRLETAGRQLGGGADFDALLHQAASMFSDGPSGLGLADKVRLVEILAGPDEAMALLKSAAISDNGCQNT